MRRSLVVLVGLLVAIAVLAVALIVALRPPALPVPAQRDWVFHDVTLVEAGRLPRPGLTLRIGAGRIRAGDAPAPIDVVEADDLAGLFVAPGLIDMHVHYPPAIAVGNAELWSLLLLAHGVTTIRETGSIDGSVFDIRRAIDAGSLPGPRIFACGAMLDGALPSFPTNRVVETPAQAREVVYEQAALGADCIKAYNMLSAEALGAIRQAAAEVGLPVVGHAPHSVGLEDAGMADLQHGTGAVVIDPETIGRFDFRTADWRSVTKARLAHVADVSLAQGIAHTPTLVNARMRRLIAGRPVGGDSVSGDTGLRHLPAFWIGVWNALWPAPFAGGDDEADAAHELFRRRQAAMAAALHERGVRVFAGTDTLMPYVAPGSSLHGELAEMATAGIAEEAVWEMATRDAGRFLGEPGLGTLAPGAPADLVFLRSDPSGDLSALTQIEAVLADGRLYRRADLDAALARFDAHFHGRLYSTVMNGVVALLQDGYRSGDENWEKP